MKSAHLYIKGDYVEIETDWTLFGTAVGVLHALRDKHHFNPVWDDQKQTYTIPIQYLKEFEDNIRKTHNVFLHNAAAVPAEPVVLRVEYIGACKKRVDTRRNLFGQQQLTCRSCRGTGVGVLTNPCIVCNGLGTVTKSYEPLSYATAWVNDGWNALFPEKVLREFFPLQEKFNGDFYKALLKGSDLSKEYKKLARQFHPDLNRRRDAHEMFVRLKEAYSSLQDPMRRKRYEAGLKFQTNTAELDVGFRIPRNCGDVTVEADFDFETQGGNRKISVKKIISWNDVIDEKGRVMCSSFNPAWRPQKGRAPNGGTSYNQVEVPFTIDWIYPGNFEIDL